MTLLTTGESSSADTDAMSSLAATATATEAKFKTSEWIYFQQSRQHSSRAGYVKTARRDGGYHVRIVQNSTIVDVERVSASDARRQMRAVRAVEQDAEFQSHAADWRVLAHDREHGGSGKKKKKAADAAVLCDAPYVALHEALRKERPSGTKNERRLRLGTFNVGGWRVQRGISQTSGATTSTIAPFPPPPPTAPPPTTPPPTTPPPTTRRPPRCATWEVAPARTLPRRSGTWPQSSGGRLQTW